MGAKQFGTPGPRSVYPELCDSRSLARCGIVANALWPRLIVRADDQGRLHGDAADVLGECFPKMLSKVTLRQVRDALAELEREGMVARYESGPKEHPETFLQILKWWGWQSYARRAYPSRMPSPDGWQDVVYGLPDTPATYREAVGIEPRKRTGLDGEDDAEPHDADAATAPEPHANRTPTASEPHDADGVRNGNRTVPPSRARGRAAEDSSSRARDPVPSRPVHSEEAVQKPDEWFTPIGPVEPVRRAS